MLFFRSFVTCHETSTAWRFHVGASQNYCVSHVSSRRSDSAYEVFRFHNDAFDKIPFELDSTENLRSFAGEIPPPTEGNGKMKDYLVNRAKTKNEGQLGKKFAQKSRNSCWAAVGLWVHRDSSRGSNGLSPRTKYERSKYFFPFTSVALKCIRVCSRLLELLAQSLIGSPCPLRGRLSNLALSMWVPILSWPRDVKFCPILSEGSIAQCPWRGWHCPQVAPSYVWQRSRQVRAPLSMILLSYISYWHH